MAESHFDDWVASRYERLWRAFATRLRTWSPAAGSSSRITSPHRYVWPAELDLMARLAGMTLRERWNDWSRAPFAGESRQHVSVWEKTAEPD